jgi:hypothetical protein
MMRKRRELSQIDELDRSPGDSSGRKQDHLGEGLEEES